MLDVYVWGSAFGLPSIDPECLALITYLHNAAPSTAWRLIPANDPSISPSNLLPAVHHDGVWTSGYRPIINYLTSNALCRDLDVDLTLAEQGDVIAYSAYLGARSGPLLDLSLYVSAANWSETTRPAYSRLLSFPLTWTVPTLIRDEAIKRAEHLGLAELDRDFDPNGGLHLTAGRDALPETFRRHLPAQTKKTLAEEMTPEQATAIRLYSVTESCLSGLEELLAEGKGDSKSVRFFATSSLSSLDCLAFGYLALMRQPPVPRPFIKDCMERVSPRLCRFLDDILGNHLLSGDLPWADPARGTVVRSAGRTLDTILRSMPSVGEHYTNEMRRRADESIKGLDYASVMFVAAVAATSAVLGYGAHFYKSLLPFGGRTQTWKPSRGITNFSHLGEAGQLLGTILDPRPSPSHGFGHLDHGAAAGARIVETNSDLD
ncbi:hypothetical protein S40293_03888 [Stachybotrys chartarum IBT 40293]|nr:hypothetical protein S40293_03888 [Stachybotrys chartarum IBT 40293]